MRAKACPHALLVRFASAHICAHETGMTVDSRMRIKGEGCAQNVPNRNQSLALLHPARRRACGFARRYAAMPGSAWGISLAG